MADDKASPQHEAPDEGAVPPPPQRGEGPPAARAPVDPAGTYWSIVWGQFRKYRLSFVALRLMLLLTLVAIYAPLISLDYPLWMRVDGTLSSPWLEQIFNRSYFLGAIDIIFNSLIFLLPAGWLVMALLRVDARRPRPGDALIVVIALALGLTLPVALGPALGWGALAALIAIPLAVRSLASGDTPRARARRRGRVLLGVIVAILGVNAYLIYAPVETSAPNVKQALLDRETRGEPAAQVVYPLFSNSFSRAAGPSNLPTVLSCIRIDGEEAAVAGDGSLEGRWLDCGPIEATWAYPLGTDKIGRDIMARMLYASRIALTIGVVAVGIYLAIGILLGSLAGYFGGWVDLVILRLVEIMLCFPSLFLIITLAALIEKATIFHVMLIIGLTRWTGPARLVRGEFLRLRSAEFVQAAKALGLPEWRIIFRHVLPNALGPVLVAATFGIASAILVESTLSFLGVGDADAPTWGWILNEGRQDQNEIMILLPGFAIFVTVSLFNLMGEGLRDALDPKMRR